jgi:outer membrane receptor protein involved in Fe transport
MVWNFPPVWGQTQEPQSKLEPVHSSITVTEKISTEAPARITVLDGVQLRQLAGVNLDDRLRMVPGFALFRRASSLTAHPTTQGVSLRGIGSTGASRSLVLWDSIPVNDPFGGWVWWTRLAPEMIERTEVSRGASTSVFGDKAMGGAIALFSRPVEKRHLTANYEFGNRNTNSAGVGYMDLFATRGPQIAISGHGRAFTTNGYYIVPERNRGSIDTPAGVRFAAGNGRVDVLGAKNRFFLKSDILSEERANGTRLLNNSTSLGGISGHLYHERANDGVSLLGYHQRMEFRSSFSTILAGRNTERLTMNQTVPAEGTGGAAYWKHSSHAWNSMLGGDFLRASGTSIDSLVPTGKRIGGGTQFQRGYFGQWNARTGPANLYLGARHHFTDQGRQFFSPSAGAAVGRGRWRTRASMYRSFRAPTLNELYREFAAGTATTLPNNLLKPETVFGAEAGIDITGEMARFQFTAFRNSLGDLITNVTLSSTPGRIVRQRRNAGSALSRGVEADFRLRWRAWSADFQYLYADSKFATNFRLPQVPKHQGSAQVNYVKGSNLFSIGFRSSALQFDDDVNVFLLPGFATFHLTAQRHLRAGLYAAAAFENLFDREFLTGLSTVPNIGAPRLWRAGLRWDGKIF